MSEGYGACREGVLADMAAHGVECVDCLSVDNALARIADPLFAGYCAEQGAQCGACSFCLSFHMHPCRCVSSPVLLCQVPGHAAHCGNDLGLVASCMHAGVPVHASGGWRGPHAW